MKGYQYSEPPTPRGEEEEEGGRQEDAAAQEPRGGGGAGRERGRFEGPAGWGMGHEYEVDQFADAPVSFGSHTTTDNVARGASRFGTNNSSISSLDSSRPGFSLYDDSINEGEDASPTIPSFSSSSRNGGRPSPSPSSSSNDYRSNSSLSNNPSLSAVQSIPKALDRGNSTRRYMEQLDPDDETESLAGGRESFDTAGSRESGALGGVNGGVRQSTMSAMTMGSTNGDPFHYAVSRALRNLGAS